MHFETFSLCSIIAALLAFAVIVAVVGFEDNARKRSDRMRRDALRRAQRRAIHAAYGR